jgi:hypothetical protein
MRVTGRHPHRQLRVCSKSDFGVVDKSQNERCGVSSASRATCHRRLALRARNPAIQSSFHAFYKGNAL